LQEGEGGSLGEGEVDSHSEEEEEEEMDLTVEKIQTDLIEETTKVS
jgi:hypothetical protein